WPVCDVSQRCDSSIIRNNLLDGMPVNDHWQAIFSFCTFDQKNNHYEVFYLSICPDTVGVHGAGPIRSDQGRFQTLSSESARAGVSTSKLAGVRTVQNSCTDGG